MSGKPSFNENLKMSEELDKPKKGFAGLNSMVSVVDVPEPEAKAKAPNLPGAEAATKKRGTAFEINMPAPIADRPFWSKTWVKWCFGGFVLLIIIAIGSDKKEVTSPDTAVYEEQPPIGNGLTLTRNQIRYCLSQKIRLDAWETAVNTYSEISVNSFNSEVENFNMRCSNYRYKKYAMEAVTSEVEANRAGLAAEGLLKASLYSGK